MLRIIFSVLLLSACSVGVTSKGGKKAYRYQPNENYKLADLREVAPSIVSTSFRNPPVSTLDQIFAPALPDIKRIGIIVFESNIQETRSGLASESGIVYPNASGKQLMTEKFHSIWEEALPLVFPEGDYVKSSVMKKSLAMHRSGAEVEDYIKSGRTNLDPDDIVFLEKGKATPTATVLNPRGMRDYSFVLVPASDLMGGPKWSEHHKHMLNEVVKELKLDAALIIMSTVSWNAVQKDPLTGESLPEQMQIKIKASTIIPFSRYHQRLKAIGIKEQPQVSVNYRTHEAMLTIPIKISPEGEEQDFSHIQNNIIDPLFRTYRDLAIMTMVSMSEDWKKTF